MISRFNPGDRVCVGPFCGRYVSQICPVTVSIGLDNGKLVHSRIELVEAEVEAMARGRKSAEKKEAEAKVADLYERLNEAIRFCAPGFKDGGDPYQTHAYIHAGWMTTYDGVLMYGHKVDFQFSALPHFGNLRSALQSAGKEFSASQIDMGRLSIKGKKARLVVPCLTDVALVSRPMPDNPISMIDSRIRDGFEIMSDIVNKNAERTIAASVLMQPELMTATDFQLCVQFYHGINFPVITVPANFIDAVLKVPKDLVSFGFSDSSLTFWFADESFIRTAVFAEQWPDLNHLFNRNWGTAAEVPADFFEAMATLRPFLHNVRHIVCNTGVMQTHLEDDIGGTFEVKGLQEAYYGISCDKLLPLRGKITHIDYYSGDKTFFMGPNLRGVCGNYDFEGAKPKPEEQPFNPPTPEPPATYETIENTPGEVDPWETP